MLDEVVQKRKVLQGAEERRDSSHLCFLIKAAEQLQKVVCCGVFSEVSVCEVRAILFRHYYASTWHHGKPSQAAQPERPKAGLKSGKGETFGKLRLCHEKKKKKMDLMAKLNCKVSHLELGASGRVRMEAQLGCVWCVTSLSPPWCRGR